MAEKKLNFAAIDQYVEYNIPSAKETSISGKDFIIWGDGNQYPEYLYELYVDVSTLHSIVEGTVDYIVGDGVAVDDIFMNEYVNDKNTTPEDLVRAIATDIMIFNGFALNVVRNRSGKVCGVHHIPIQRLRTDKDRKKFYYSEDWTKSYGRVKTLELPAFSPNSTDASSIYYWCTNNVGTYPVPMWCGAIKACEIEKNINDYHLNAINNGFTASYMINFNNGVPEDTQKAEIEKYVNEKLAGSKNAGRILLSFNDGKDRASELLKLDVEDYGEKYKTLAERTKQEMFTAFRAIPNLFGLPTATGFSNEEYEQAFKLYNRTAVRPKQKVIEDSFFYITGHKLEIKPFTL